MAFGQGRSGGGGRGRGGDKKPGDKEKGQRRTLFRRRKVCKFCADKIDDINYKDVKLIGPFVPERGKILPRRISGTCAMHQRKLQTAIKRASRSRSCRTSRIDERHPMEVILREHVDNLGRRGEVVKVADGYARNYLLPRKLALLATEGNKKQIEREKVKFDLKEAEEQKVAQAMAERIGNIDVEIARKVGETDALYGSVTTSDIADALAKKGFEVDRRKLVCKSRSRSSVSTAFPSSCTAK
jgi:large subunit ribosomal protein L9